MANKYKAKKCTVDGITFDSKKEAKRYGELKLLVRAGEISHLELQPDFEVAINGKHICNYKADFGYVDVKTKEVIIEDVKSVATSQISTYRLKKKLVEAIYQIEIKEV